MAANFKAAKKSVQQVLKRNENMLRVTDMLKRPQATAKLEAVQTFLRSALANIDRSLAPPAYEELQKACAAVDEVPPGLPGYGKEATAVKAILAQAMQALNA